MMGFVFLLNSPLSLREFKTAFFRNSFLMNSGKFRFTQKLILPRTVHLNLRNKYMLQFIVIYLICGQKIGLFSHLYRFREKITKHCRQ